MKKKRDKPTIIYDILRVIHNTPKNLILITHILTKANLSYNKLKEYLVELQDNGFIEEKIVKGKKYYSLTENGFEYFYKLEELKAFMKCFED